MIAKALKDTELDGIKAAGSNNTGNVAEFDEDEDDKIFKSLKENNCFKLTTNMAKVMEGQKGGGFYAAIIQDKGTKNNQIGVVIQYPDGEESELIKFSQGEYLQAGRLGFKQVTYKKGGSITKKLPFAEKFQNTLMEYMTPNMPIWPDVVMRTIYEKYDKLPVIKVFEKAPGIEEIYKYLSTIAKELSSDEDKGYMNHKDYYRFTRDDLEELAKGLGVNITSLVETLDSYGLISRTPSSIGFQTKINYKNKRFYTYNICKELSDVQVDVQKNVEGEFPTAKFDVKYLSPSERYKLKMDEKEKECQAKMGVDNWAEIEFEREFGPIMRAVQSSKSSNSNGIVKQTDDGSKSSKDKG